VAAVWIALVARAGAHVGSLQTLTSAESVNVAGLQCFTRHCLRQF
jgi:hypothetical protein